MIMRFEYKTESNAFIALSCDEMEEMRIIFFIRTHFANAEQVNDYLFFVLFFLFILLSKADGNGKSRRCQSEQNFIFLLANRYFDCVKLIGWMF